jgi:DNA-binding Lrp family transcriptional regulator
MTDSTNNSIDDFSALEQHLLNDFQRDMSLSATPYADMATKLGVSEEEVLQKIQKLQDNGVVSRVGPVFRPNRIGVSTLAAMSVPADKLECTARIVSAFPEVNHNYERDHHYNLWFVVTASSEEHLDIVLYEIEQHTEQALMSLPMLDDYFIDLGFKLTDNPKQATS